MHLVGQLQAYINNMQMGYNSQTDLEAWCLVLVRIIMLPEFGESLFSFFIVYCIGQEGLYTSLKPEEALIYLYNGRE